MKEHLYVDYKDMKMSEKLLIPSERKARFNGENKREIPQIKQNSRINRNTYNRKCLIYT